MNVEVELQDIQGNILRGYGLPRAYHFLLKLDSAGSARNLLAEIGDDVTPAAARRKPDQALNVAITYAGFRTLGVRQELLDAFPKAFRERPRDRARSLGDVEASAPSKWQDEIGTGDVDIVVTVHSNDDRLAPVAGDWTERLQGQRGVTLVYTQETRVLCNAVEHFGFADGASQPAVEGVSREGDAAARGGGVPLRDGRWRPVKAGEFILGYPDEDGRVEERPHPALVRNGSYMVWRKLEQDVPKFRDTLRRAADEVGLTVETMAAKVVGRWRDGTPIELAPWRSDEEGLTCRAVDAPPNDFRYCPHDRDGEVCPAGAHIRRTNPRDAIEFGKAVQESGILTARHRIIRRGMPYGPMLPLNAEDDGDPEVLAEAPERGLLFICYQADLERQFELIQKAWCADGDAFFLGEDQDFLLGNGGGSGKMTIPMRDAPPKFIETVPDLVVTRGMEYLFAPGLAALRRLAGGHFD